MKPENRGPIGVIAGTGVTEHFELSRRKVVRTEFGSAAVFRTENGHYVLPRHGLGRAVPPHMVNYRANVASLRRLGVQRIIATSAVGSMNLRAGVGSLGVAGQFLDFTRGRNGTFFDRTANYTDMTTPYSAELNGAVVRAGKRLGIRVMTGLVYVCVEGPRFETAAEIRMFRKMGGDVVGMTGVPEVVLANELGMEYASIAVVTNWAAGVRGRVSHDAVLAQMEKTGPKVKSLIVAATELLGEEQTH